MFIGIGYVIASAGLFETRVIVGYVKLIKVGRVAGVHVMVKAPQKLGSTRFTAAELVIVAS